MGNLSRESCEGGSYISGSRWNVSIICIGSSHPLFILIVIQLNLNCLPEYMTHTSGADAGTMKLLAVSREAAVLLDDKPVQMF
jgi:hypothetical protein